jgi:hypothetical protein
MAWKIENLSNPNFAPNPIQNNNNQSEVKKYYNRATATRRDTDTHKNLSITLMDVDSTIMYHLENNLRLQVVDNGEVVRIPIIYGNPERWVAMKKYGYLRDNQGKILLPAFMIRRKSVENNKDLMTFNRYLQSEVMMSYSEKNKYDRFDLMNNGLFKSKPTKQIYAVSLPNHIIATYECIIWTDFVDQNNKVLEQINYASKDYWGDRERFKFRARVDSYSVEQEVNDGEDRNVKTTFDIIVNAYLLNDNTVNSMSGIKNTTNKLFTVRKIKLEENTVSSIEELNNIPQPKFEDTTHLKDKNSDYNRVDTNIMELNPDNSTDNSGYNKIPNINAQKTLFHPAPKSITDYGEDGWLAYDSKYIYVYKSPLGWLKREISTFDYDYSVQQYITGYDCNGNPVYSNINRRPINTAFRVFQRFPEKYYYQVPYQSSDYGQDGWISYDNEYFYIYSSGEWRRVPISLFNPI